MTTLGFLIGFMFIAVLFSGHIVNWKIRRLQTSADKKGFGPEFQDALIKLKVEAVHRRQDFRPMDIFEIDQRATHAFHALSSKSHCFQIPESKKEARASQ